jgi:hypothetical protein
LEVQDLFSKNQKRKMGEGVAQVTSVCHASPRLEFKYLCHFKKRKSKKEEEAT